MLGLYGSAVAAPKIRITPKPAQSTQDNFRSCKTLLRCVDILERHRADSFDYAVLARDFDRHGDKAREVLWRIVGKAKLDGPETDGSETDGSETEQATELATEHANRALDMLSRSPKILKPADQRRMAALWKNIDRSDYDPAFVARLMQVNLSPMVRSMAVQTLASDNPDVARLSRGLIAQSLIAKMSFPMLESDFAPLSTALRERPSPTLVSLMNEYPSEQADPILAKLLSSGHSPSVIAAYGALYKRSPERAFKALVATLYGLKNGSQGDEARAALAIGNMLAYRHPLREDGFYLNFADDLAGDAQMSGAGRLAGFTALLQMQEKKEARPLKNTAFNRASFATALGALTGKNIPEYYFTVPHRLGLGAKDANVDHWLAPLRTAATTARSKLLLTEIAGGFDTRLAQDIAREALDNQGDYRLTTAGILASTAQSSKASLNSKASLAASLQAQMKTHPVTLVRAAADIGLSALKSKSPRKAVLKSQATLASKARSFEPRSQFCAVTTTDLRALALPMPFYQPARLARGGLAERAYQTSGARTSTGWLAGYSRPSIRGHGIDIKGIDGGLVSYDNKTGEGVELFGHNKSGKSEFGAQAVIAVQPINRVALGDRAREFWIIASSIESGESAVYKAVQSGTTFAITRHFVLPALPSATEIKDSVDIVIAFKPEDGGNPPLRLSPNGEVTRACD